MAARPNRFVGLASGVGRRRSLRFLCREVPALRLPFATPAVDEADLVMPVDLEMPVRVCSEPGVVAALQDNVVIVGDGRGLGRYERVVLRRTSLFTKTLQNMVAARRPKT